MQLLLSLQYFDIFNNLSILCSETSGYSTTVAKHIKGSLYHWGVFVILCRLRSIFSEYNQEKADAIQ